LNSSTRPLVEKKQRLKDGDGKTGATTAQKEFAALEKHWQLAKDRFDLVIQKQKLLQAQMAIFRNK
jgi:hypothetical protein